MSYSDELDRAVNWRPHIRAGAGPIYQQVSRQLIDDIRNERLKVGAMLPSHRDLAKELGVTTATITKAYKEVARLNLVSGRARSGTRVVQIQSQLAGWSGVHRDEKGTFDLASNCPPTDRYLFELSVALPKLVERTEFRNLQEYIPVAGLPSHRAAGSLWLNALGVPCTDKQITVVNGAQHGLAAVLSSQTKSGGVLLTEELTYAPLLHLALKMNLDVRPIALDSEGVIPESLEAQCRHRRGGILVVTPNISNPTTATMGVKRREEVARIARSYGLTIVEDDVYRMFGDASVPTLAELAPERTFYITSFSKCIAPGLRIGYVRAPDEIESERVAAAVGLSTRMATPIMAEIATLWIEDGTARRIIDWQRRELQERNAIAVKALQGHIFATQSAAMHLWLTLENGWNAPEFRDAAERQGILVVPASAYAAGKGAPQAVRVTLGGTRNQKDLQTAVQRVSALLQAEPWAQSASA